MFRLLLAYFSPIQCDSSARLTLFLFVPDQPHIHHKDTKTHKHIIHVHNLWLLFCYHFDAVCWWGISFNIFVCVIRSYDILLILIYAPFKFQDIHILFGPYKMWKCFCLIYRSNWSKSNNFLLRLWIRLNDIYVFCMLHFSAVVRHDYYFKVFLLTGLLPFFVAIARLCFRLHSPVFIILARVHTVQLNSG